VPAASNVAGAVTAAQTFIEAGDLVAAMTALRAALAGVELDATRPGPDLADACRLYAGVLSALGEAYSATPFSTYAHVACRALFPATDDRALYADATHAFVLRVTGEFVGAVDHPLQLGPRCRRITGIVLHFREQEGGPRRVAGAGVFVGELARCFPRLRDIVRARGLRYRIEQHRCFFRLPCRPPPPALDGGRGHAGDHEHGGHRIAPAGPPRFQVV
jgi:hypothetical protein